jgi:hypothetical protein
LNKERANKEDDGSAAASLRARSREGEQRKREGEQRKGEGEIERGLTAAKRLRLGFEEEATIMYVMLKVCVVIRFVLCLLDFGCGLPFLYLWAKSYK